jgi:hypothetical protein
MNQALIITLIENFRSQLMSIISSALKLIIRAHKDYHFSGRMLTLAVPDVYATSKNIESWFAKYAGQTVKLDQNDINLSTNKICRKLGFVTGHTFFKTFGFDAIDSLDIPGCEHTADIEHDLNTPLPEHLHGKYQFLMDPGTLEHIFDQRQCLETCHRALAIGGVICHFVPIYSYNGGYYSINPNVIHDFYAANGFGENQAYVIMWDRYKSYSTGKTRIYRYDTALMGSRHAVADLDQVRYTPHLLYFARKQSNPETLVCPIQFDGDYVGQATSLAESRSQTLESKGKDIALLVPYGNLSAERSLPLAHLLARALHRQF